MLPAPYAGSLVHCPSVEQPPQVLARAMPHSCPVGQSEDDPWQSPEMQPPEIQTVEAPESGSALQAVSTAQGWHMRVGVSQMCPPTQSAEARHSPVTQTLPMQRCCEPYAGTQAASLAHAIQENVLVSQIWPPPPQSRLV